MHARIDEVAIDVFRISLYVPQIDLQFNHFLIRDEEPLLFHTGLRGMFPAVREAVASIIDPLTLRWISWSHFEVDECGALNEWLAVSPKAVPVCGELGAMININDFANRPPRALKPDEVLVTGRHRFRFVPTPHLPHGWDAGVLFEEADRVLLCSDLLHQIGDVEPTTTADITGRYRHALETYQKSPVLMDYVPVHGQHEATAREARGVEAAHAGGDARVHVHRRWCRAPHRERQHPSRCERGGASQRSGVATCCKGCSD